MKLFSRVWACSFSLLLISRATCSNLKSVESVRRSVRGREMITDNLRRFHGGLEPIPFVPHILDTNDNGYIPVKGFPDDIFLYIADDLSLFKDSQSLFSTCKYTEQFRIQTINKRLADFNPHYLFEEQWLNNLMYRVIKENFPSGWKLENNGIHDYVELMTLKYSITYTKPSKPGKYMPKHLHHAILTFIHETVYGPGQNVPCDHRYWQRYTAYKITGFRLPLTVEYYTKHFGQNDIYTRYYQFLLEPRTRAEREEYAYSKGNFGPLTHDFINFEWNTEDKLSETEAKGLLRSLGDNQIYSEHIMKRIELTERINEFLIQMTQGHSTNSKHIYERFRRILHRKAGIPLAKPINNCVSFIKSRDLNAQFEIEVLISFDDFEPWTVFRVAVETDLPYLIKMEIISKLVRSGLIPLNHIEPVTSYYFISALQMLAQHKLPFFELVLIEYPHLVNLENLKLPLSDHMYMPRILFLIATQFTRNNPLAAAKYLQSELSSPFYTNLIEKFNLNVSYKFDTNFNYLFLPSWDNKDLSFREIMKEVDDTNTRRAFGLRTLRDFEESEEQKQAYPVISLRDFVNDPNLII